MSYCIINSKNFSHNIKVISKHISADKIAFVLKNNAYGHGLIEMAEIAQANNIKHAVVINCDEANKINKYFESIDIRFQSEFSNKTLGVFQTLRSPLGAQLIIIERSDSLLMTRIA